MRWKSSVDLCIDIWKSRKKRKLAWMLTWEILTTMQIFKRIQIEGKHKVSEEEQTIQINKIKYNRDCVSVKRRYRNSLIKLIDL